MLRFFPSAKALVDGVPVPELIGQVAPWGTGACLVEDGFDEHPVAEDRGAAGSVLEFAQDRLDFGPHDIRDEKTQGHDSSPKKEHRRRTYQYLANSSTRPSSSANHDRKYASGHGWPPRRLGSRTAHHRLTATGQT